MKMYCRNSNNKDSLPRAPNVDLLSRLLDKNNKQENSALPMVLKSSTTPLKFESRVIAAIVAASLYKKSDTCVGQEAQQTSPLIIPEQPKFPWSDYVQNTFESDVKVVEQKNEPFTSPAVHAFSSPLRTNKIDSITETPKNRNSHLWNCSPVCSSLLMIRESYASPLNDSPCSYNGCGHQDLCQSCQNGNATSSDGLSTPFTSSSPDSMTSSSCSSINNLFNHSQDVSPKSGSKACTCQRSPKIILCKSCGEVFTGRVRQMCPAHPKQFFLMDFNYCYICSSQNLKEIGSAKLQQSELV